MGLTKRDVERAAYTGKANSRCVYWDDDPHGLGLRVFPSGRKAYVLSYRLDGRKRLMTLGDQAVMTLEQARKRARHELHELENHDTDPLAEKRKRMLEARTGTVETMFRAYVADRNPRRPEALLWYGEKFVFPRFGGRPWRDVRRSEVRDWHAGIDSPYNANRALQALRAAFYWRLWSEDDSAGSADAQAKRDTRNPCAGIPLRPEKVRQVRLEVADVPKLERAIDAKTEDPYLRAYFRFLLATGCRRSEASNLTWAQVRLAGPSPSVTFLRTKTEPERTVPLSGQAVKLLRALPQVEGNPHVFIGRREKSALTEPGKAWQRIRKAAGLPHIRIHDLRRSFGSWLGESGFTSKQIGTVLGHKTDITSRVYMALGEKSAREAVTAVETIMRKAKKSPRRRKAEVIPLRQRA